MRKHTASPLLLGASLAAVLVLAACGEGGAPPAQQAGQALAAARENIERARSAIQATEAHSKALQGKIQAQREELKDLIERRVVLMRQQLQAYEERVRVLPAAKETELRPRIAELAKTVDDVQAKLQAYRDAPQAKSAEALAALEQSLAALAERRRELEAQIAPA